MNDTTVGYVQTEWSVPVITELLDRLYRAGRVARACKIADPIFVFPVHNNAAREALLTAIVAYFRSFYGDPSELLKQIDPLHCGNPTLIHFPTRHITLALMTV